MSCFFSCNLKHEPTFNKRIIENISNADINYPPPYFGMFFCKGQNGQILPLNAGELRDIYSKEFRQLNYKSFLSELLNQNIEVKYNNHKGFILDPEVESHYKSLDINEFINFYCVKTSETSYTLNKTFPKIKKYSIFYFLFINNYLTSFDDIGGFYLIKKIDFSLSLHPN